MHLRHLQYLVTLAQEKHFGRAAELCCVTQSTLSAAIRHLEDEIGAPMIERGNRFKALTAEGETVVAWARRILDERRALDQQLTSLRNGLHGRLRLGVIPAALPTVALLTTPFNDRYPFVSFRLHSRTSNEIQRELDEFEIDAGLTYIDNEPLRDLRSVPLYDERYILLTPANGPFAGRDRVTWQEAAEVELCLLTPDMQNRRIIDGIFREIGMRPNAHVETNSVMTLCSHIRAGAFSSVMPHNFLWAMGTPPGMLALPLVEPACSHLVGLVFRDREPVPPMIAALEALARKCDMARIIDRVTTAAEAVPA